jgi:hypothetical protein
MITLADFSLIYHPLSKYPILFQVLIVLFPKFAQNLPIYRGEKFVQSIADNFTKQIYNMHFSEK